MSMSVRSDWSLKWVLPALGCGIIGMLLYLALHWAANRSDTVAEAREQNLVNLVVSKMRYAVAHDQESATVWDDAVRHTAERDLEWLKLNLGDWMNTYFSHDAAIVLSADLQPIYTFNRQSESAPTAQDLAVAYTPLAESLHERLFRGDTEGVTEKVLSIGESDLVLVNRRPAVVSVKPIISDTGDLPQTPGEENLHVAVRFLDAAFPAEIGNEYQFNEMQFGDSLPSGTARSFVPLTSRSGKIIGYFSWKPFKPGASVMDATLPVLALVMVAVFSAARLCGHAIWRRSVKLEASRHELHHLALHDPLTGLANRACFTEELAVRLSKVPKSEGTCVLFIDLDRFKAVNDTFGHPVGDKLISMVAARLKEISKGALVARIGGDEFIILLEQADDKCVSTICCEIVERLREPFDIDAAHVVVGASVGAAAVMGSADPLELTRQADIALYHAKAAGRSTYAIFGSHMDELLRRRRKLENELRLALETKTQLETFYQPVFSAKEGGVTSVEALARWRHPTEGYVSPDEFIPIAEEIGLVHDIGALVLRDACKLMVDLPNISVAINASAHELASEGYPLRVLTSLADWGISPDRLEIEITESLALTEEERSHRNIELLRSAGVQFAIDDFGTGYSSFSRLQNVHVDRIKIDRSFVADMHGQSSPFIAAMINMAHAKGLKATAEGVETMEQSETLRAFGCDNLQGFLMARPLAHEAILTLLDDKQDAVASGRATPAA